MSKLKINQQVKRIEVSAFELENEIGQDKDKKQEIKNNLVSKLKKENIKADYSTFINALSVQLKGIK